MNGSSAPNADPSPRGQCDREARFIGFLWGTFDERQESLDWKPPSVESKSANRGGQNVKTAPSRIERLMWLQWLGPSPAFVIFAATRMCL